MTKHITYDVLTRGRVVMKLYLLIGTSNAAEDYDEKFYLILTLWNVDAISGLHVESYKKRAHH